MQKRPTAKKPVANKEIVQEQEVMTAPQKQEPAKTKLGNKR